MSNRLAKETSPYLLQHAENPVDWYPWGDEAFEAARQRDVPVLLSVGYSSCHWCHVMERESFENEQIADMMNRWFVNIKVDREERPDVDSVYMTAIQALTGHGGWPMTVFLTTEGEPFYGGTYFPPEDRGGLPSFVRVLETISEAYVSRKSDVLQSGKQLVERLRQAYTPDPGVEPLTESILNTAFEAALTQFDDRSGGFGLQPKFPQPATLEFILRFYARSGVPLALEMVEHTLSKMAAGGIHDQIGGGFHRYSTDAFWLVPHFEKMLYDNALLARLYTHAYQLTGNQEFRRTAERVNDYVVREMTSPDVGFYSAQDADSEGVEGKFFVWRPEHLVQVLGADDAAIVADYYGVTDEGNFEGMSILNVPAPPAEVASRHSMSVRELETLLDSANDRLLEARSSRVPPMTDTKTIVSWNGLMLAAIAEASAVFERDDYLEVARANASYLLDEMVESGRLRRTDSNSENGSRGFLDDYASLIDGLLVLHSADGDPRWLLEAETLARNAVDLFWDPLRGQFYDTGSDQEALIVRPRDVTDNAHPSGHSMMTDVLIRLATITGNSDFRTMAGQSLRGVRGIMEQFPTGAGHWLCALDSYLADSKEAVVVTDVDHTEATLMLRRLASVFEPSAVRVSMTSDSNRSDEWPVFSGRTTVNGQPTAYVCRNYTCQLPTNDADAMMAEFAR
ncbi:MAG: thioredoxin domain-containing protein [Dehalococcoidia bacterium]|nr:thioredoxin domain-containing protein [Dehalococcoidia bacterium]